MTQHAPQASAAHLNRVLLDTNDLTCPSERAWKLLEIHAAMDRAPTPAPIRHFWTRSWNATLRELRPPLRAAFRSLHAPPARTLRPPPTALILAALAAVVRPPCAPRCCSPPPGPRGAPGTTPPGTGAPSTPASRPPGRPPVERKPDPHRHCRHGRAARFPTQPDT